MDISKIFMASKALFTQRSKSSKLAFLACNVFSLLMFNMYTSDVTAKMTLGAPPRVVRSFQDAYDQGIPVFAMSASSQETQLRSSKPGTAMHR